MGSNSVKKLTVDSIKSVLNSMIYANEEYKTFEEIANLQVIQQTLLSIHHKRIGKVALTEHVVQLFIAKVISQELILLRRAQGIETQQTDRLLTKKKAMEHIRRDAEANVPQLIGWSLLYHIYVQPELGISHGEFAMLSHIEARTLRRYKNQAIHNLLKRVIELELDSQLLSPSTDFPRP